MEEKDGERIDDVEEKERTKASYSTPWLPSMRIMFLSSGLTWEESTEIFLCEA